MPKGLSDGGNSSAESPSSQATVVRDNTNPRVHVAEVQGTEVATELSFTEGAPTTMQLLEKPSLHRSSEQASANRKWNVRVPASPEYGLSG